MEETKICHFFTTKETDKFPYHFTIYFNYRYIYTNTASINFFDEIIQKYQNLIFNKSNYNDKFNLIDDVKFYFKRVTYISAFISIQFRAIKKDLKFIECILRKNS